MSVAPTNRFVSTEVSKTRQKTFTKFRMVTVRQGSYWRNCDNVR